MEHINILSDREVKTFERPPVLNQTEREAVFTLPHWAEEQLNSMHRNISRTGFILQLGYVQVTGRFFPPDTFLPDDISYASAITGALKCPTNMKKYTSSLPKASFPQRGLWHGH